MSVLGAAKMSPIAEPNWNNPTQAGEASSVVAPLTKTMMRLSPGTIVGIVAGAIVVVVAILMASFCFWRKRKMRSAVTAGRFIPVEETEKAGSGIGSGMKAEKYEAAVPAKREEKSLPPHPEEANTPTHESFSGVRESGLTLNFESSPTPKDVLSQSSYLQPTTYIPASKSTQKQQQRESGTFSKGNQSQDPNRSTVSSFFPSNAAHKSVASSFFASIPILLDSREGRCDDCLQNREKYRSIFRRSGASSTSSTRTSGPACTCSHGHGHHSTAATENGGGSSRGVSEVSITRSEVEEELLVGRVPTLFSERGISRLSQDSDRWVDELALERELSNISEESEVKPLRSNPFILPPQPLVLKKPTKEIFDFGFRGRS
jgi:hypothetical protein